MAPAEEDGEREEVMEGANAFFEQAREIARAERELGFARWVVITIEAVDDARNIVALVRYDLPLEVEERRPWVIEWRAAWLKCRHPRCHVRTFHSHYRRFKGEDIGMQKDLDRFFAAKAQVTRAERLLKEYLRAKEKENDMFWDADNDADVSAMRDKIKAKKASVESAEERLKEKIQIYEKEHQ